MNRARLSLLALAAFLLVACGGAATDVTRDPPALTSSPNGVVAATPEGALGAQPKGAPDTGGDGATGLPREGAEERPRPSGNAPRAKSEAPPDTKAHLVSIAGSPVRGKDTALVTLVEFADFQCMFCQRAEPTVRALEAKYGEKLRVVWKNMPLAMHERAEPAAELAALVFKRKGNDAFWLAHDALLDPNGALDAEALAHAADDAGVDGKAALPDVSARAFRDAVGADQDLADDLGVTSTPQFFINGRRLKGAQPQADFETLIDSELAAAEARVAAGTAPADVYDAIMRTAEAPPPLATKTAPLVTRANATRGPSNAPVTVQIFGDFQCPFCKRLQPTIATLEADFPGKIRVVFRNLPLTAHKNAMPAAKAALEAKRQGGEKVFWKFHDALYATDATSDTLTRPGLETIAKGLGLNMTAFDRALDADTPHEIGDDMKLADSLEIHGTPTTLVNDFVVVGAMPLGRFEHLVRRALSGKK